MTTDDIDLDTELVAEISFENGENMAVDLDSEIALFIVEKLKILHAYVQTDNYSSVPMIDQKDIPALVAQGSVKEQWIWIIQQMIYAFDNYDYHQNKETFYFGRRLFAKYFTHLYT